jgi:hypothetical protein
MEKFQLFAHPWWVNLLFLLPFVAYYFFGQSLHVAKRTLAAAALFGIAFGFVEAAVVVYLRAATGMLPGYAGAIPSSGTLPEQAQVVSQLAKNLFTMEVFREIATLIMLSSVAFLAARTFKERCAVFLWIFACWDIFYYAGLWATVHWPGSLTTPDVLFLIPVPWYAQVWFPILVSALTILVVLSRRDT